MSQIKLEDLFEIEYDETDPDWFIIKAKPEFANHRIRLVSIRARLDFWNSRKEESISIGSHTSENDFHTKFNSMYLEKYDKSPEQGYYGRTQLYLNTKEVKVKKRRQK